MGPLAGAPLALLFEVGLSLPPQALKIVVLATETVMKPLHFMNLRRSIGQLVNKSVFEQK
jgi:hypothetical protein